MRVKRGNRAMRVKKYRQSDIILCGFEYYFAVKN